MQAASEREAGALRWGLWGEGGTSEQAQQQRRDGGGGGEGGLHEPLGAGGGKSGENGAVGQLYRF